jgi:peptidoglycan/LPS O-acetylase OafA/YrhL
MGHSTGNPAAKTASRTGSGADDSFRLGYRRGLDGLRGIAILAVVLFHARLASAQVGYIGVQIFFSLSGFLITCLLVEEWARFHSIGVGRFYLRRVLRLFPALVLMLLAFVAFAGLAGPRAAAKLAVREAVIALFYASNWACAFSPHRPYFLGHTWSLSIEEQFYLLWPLFLLWALRRGVSRASLLNWLLLGFFAAIASRCLQYVRWGDPYRLSFGTDTQADSLVLGCALAVVLEPALLRRNPRVDVVLGWCSAASLAGLLWLGLSAPWDWGLQARLGFPLIALLATLTVLGVVVSPASVLGRLVSNRCLVWLGRISYGLYLWHLPVFLETQLRQLPFWKELSVELSLTFAFVLASYYALERPLLRLKTRFVRVGGVPAGIPSPGAGPN